MDSQVKSLTSQYPGLKIRVLCGNCDDTSRYRQEGVEVLDHDDLDYLYDENPPADKIAGVTARLMQYIKEPTDENEILHVHNLNLGKNPIELEHYKKWRSFCRENELNNVHFEVGEAIDFPTLVKGSDFCITTSIREGFGMTYMEPWLYHTPVIGRKIDYITHDFINKGLIFSGLYEKINLAGKISCRTPCSRISSPAGSA